MKKTIPVKKLTLAAVFLALCMILPFLTGQIPEIGSALCPMHIPVLLCGFACGWQYGTVIGFLAPLLRFLLFGMPPIFPTGAAMAFELAVYGLTAGLFYSLLTKRTLHIYVSLIGAMLAGRAVWGAVMFVLSKVSDVPFSLSVFLNGAFITALPGIICHIVLIPILVLALRKARLIPNE